MAEAPDNQHAGPVEKPIFIGDNVRDGPPSMKFIPQWLRDPEIRNILSFVGGGVAVVAAGVWTVSVYLNDHPTTPAQAMTCAPTISGQDGKVVWSCGLPGPNALNAATNTLNELREELAMVLSGKEMELFPLMEQYQQNPTPAAWSEVLGAAAKVLQLVRDASTDIVKVDAQLNAQMAPLISYVRDPQGVRNILSHIATQAFAPRITILDEMRQNPAPTKDEAKNWEARLKALVSSLDNDLSQLKLQLLQPSCQRRSKNASAGRSKNTSAMLARRPPNWGPFVRHQTWAGLSAGVSELARRERLLL